MRSIFQTKPPEPPPPPPIVVRQLLPRVSQFYVVTITKRVSFALYFFWIEYFFHKKSFLTHLHFVAILQFLKPERSKCVQKQLYPKGHTGMSLGKD